MKKIILFTAVLCVGVFNYTCITKIESFTDIDAPRFSGDYAPVLPANPEEIIIASFNIEFAIKIDEALKEIQSSAYFNNADIIMLQEMDEVGTDVIAEALECNYVYYPSSRNTDGQLFGLAVLTKWPIIEDEKILLPHEAINKRRRIAVSAKVLIGEKSVRIYNLHTATFTLPKSKRRDQFRTIITHLHQLEGSETIEHVIIGGDFNTDKSNDLDYLVQLYGNEGFSWASEEIGPTSQILSGLRKLSLDHIFTRGFDLINAGKNQETRASDHLPIWVQLRCL